MVGTYKKQHLMLHNKYNTNGINAMPKLKWPKGTGADIYEHTKRGENRQKQVQRLHLKIEKITWDAFFTGSYRICLFNI